MPRRVSPIEIIRAQIDELFASGNELGSVLDLVGRLTVQLNGHRDRGRRLLGPQSLRTQERGRSGRIPQRAPEPGRR